MTHLASELGDKDNVAESLLFEVRSHASRGEYVPVRRLIETTADSQRDAMREEAAVAASWRGDFLVSASFVEEISDYARLAQMQERLSAAERGFQEYLASL